MLEEWEEGSHTERAVREGFRAEPAPGEVLSDGSLVRGTSLATCEGNEINARHLDNGWMRFLKYVCDIYEGKRFLGLRDDDDVRLVAVEWQDQK